jgi:hypothetical protein
MARFAEGLEVHALPSPKKKPRRGKSMNIVDADSLQELGLEV